MFSSTCTCSFVISKEMFVHVTFIVDSSSRFFLFRIICEKFLSLPSQHFNDHDVNVTRRSTTSESKGHLNCKSANGMYCKLNVCGSKQKARSRPCFVNYLTIESDSFKNVPLERHSREHDRHVPYVVVAISKTRFTPCSL